jgi:hypothetical protein
MTSAKKGVSEEKCRSILERIYCEKFPSVRPDFLVNPETGRCLELDCYNERLGIACEYNGIQHYKYPNPFHKTKKEYIDQIRRDKFKIKVCKYNKILLISVPYTVTDIQTYLEEKLCRYTRLLIEKRILTKINLTGCTILKDYLKSRLKIKPKNSPGTQLDCEKDSGSDTRKDAHKSGSDTRKVDRKIGTDTRKDDKSGSDGGKYSTDSHKKSRTDTRKYSGSDTRKVRRKHESKTKVRSSDSRRKSRTDTRKVDRKVRTDSRKDAHKSRTDTRKVDRKVRTDSGKVDRKVGTDRKKRRKDTSKSRTDDKRVNRKSGSR